MDNKTELELNLEATEKELKRVRKSLKKLQELEFDREAIATDIVIEQNRTVRGSYETIVTVTAWDEELGRPELHRYYQPKVTEEIHTKPKAEMLIDLYLKSRADQRKVTCKDCEIGNHYHICN